MSAISAISAMTHSAIERDEGDGYKNIKPTQQGCVPKKKYEAMET